MLTPIDELEMKDFVGKLEKTFRRSDDPTRALAVDYERQVLVIGDYEYPLSDARRWKPQPQNLATVHLSKIASAPSVIEGANAEQAKDQGAGKKGSKR